MHLHLPTLLASSYSHTHSPFSSTIGVYVKMGAEDKGEDQLKAVSFAAGTAAFMAACIERAVMVSVFAHWRVWAFVALNLLLLAILFTSKSQIPFNQKHCKKGDAELKKSNKRMHRNNLVSTRATEVAPPPEPSSCVERAPSPESVVEPEIENAETEKLEEYDQLSEEELKQRVEDFIAMFRQHLICDAKGAKFMECANTITSRVY